MKKKIAILLFGAFFLCGQSVVCMIREKTEDQKITEKLLKNPVILERMVSVLSKERTVIPYEIIQMFSSKERIGAGKICGVWLTQGKSEINVEICTSEPWVKEKFISFIDFFSNQLGNWIDKNQEYSIKAQSGDNVVVIDHSNIKKAIKCLMKIDRRNTCPIFANSRKTSTIVHVASGVSSIAIRIFFPAIFVPTFPLHLLLTILIGKKMDSLQREWWLKEHFFDKLNAP